MTYEELKKTAAEMGYNLTKKEPYVRLKKHCGVYPHNWFTANPGGVGQYYRCPVCGLETGLHSTEKKARIAWNEVADDLQK